MIIEIKIEDILNSDDHRFIMKHGEKFI